MKIAGFTFVRNAIKNDYPIVEAITSILPICDEFIIACGNSSDNTLKLIQSINSPKIKTINTIWNENLREGGKVFAEETDKAFNSISQNVDWAFYIQADECVHEKYLDTIKNEMKKYLYSKSVEGLLFKYKHFYGSYNYYALSRKWYRREIRIIRRNLSIKSYKDAQGFRLNNSKLKVKLIDAEIFHYGWVKSSTGILNKMQNFNFFYDKNITIESISNDKKFDYGNADKLFQFKDMHPKVMLDRVVLSNWDFNPSKCKNKRSIQHRILQKIYELTGIRLFEYKNYKLIK